MTTDTKQNDRGRVDLNLAGRFTILIGMAISSYGLMGLAPILPAIAAAFPDQPNAAFLTRLMVSTSGIFVGLVAPIVGGVADRVGQRRVFLAALLLYAVAGCAPFFLDSIAAIVVARMFHGIAVAAYGTIFLVLLAKHSVGNARDRWLGYLVIVATLSSIVSNPMVGYIAHDFGWRAVFLTYALALPLFALAFVGVPPDEARVASNSAAADHPADTSDFTALDQVRYGIFALLCGGVMMASMVFIPFRLREIGVADPRAIGTMMMSLAVAGIPASFAYGRVRAHLSALATFVIGFSLLAAGAAVIATVSSPPLMIAGMFIGGLGNGLTVPNFWSFAAVTGPERTRARVMGFAKGGCNGGPLIVQLMLEPVLAHSNYATVFGVLAAACAVFVVYFAWRMAGRRASVVAA